MRHIRLSSGAAGGEGHTQRDDVMSTTNGDDVAALRASLLDIQQRLAHIEAHLTHDATCVPAAQKDGGESMFRYNTGSASQTGQTNHTSTTPTRSPWLSGTYVPATAHPSGEHFQIGEAVSELVDYFEREKICSLEPGEKPCDNCGMCSARGF